MSDFKPLFTWRSAIADSDLPATTRHVALTLSLHMNERGGSCYPSAQALAKETGLNISTVREHRAYLELAGWIQCVERGGIKGERRRASAYEATIPADPSSSPTHPAPRPVGETALTPRPNRADPSSSPTPGLQEFSKRSSRAPAARSAAFEADFDKAWKHYPRKVARKDALRAYQARRREAVPADDLHQAVIVFAEKMRREGRGPEHIMHGSRFFGPGEHWRETLDAKSNRREPNANDIATGRY